MRRIVVGFLLLTISACVAVPQGPQVAGGTRITQLGISFAVPEGRSWTVLVQSTYQAMLGARGNSPNETLITAIGTYNVPAFDVPEGFLNFVKSGRANEPKTGTFEVIRNDEQWYAERSETCVKHESAAKDFAAKRGGAFTMIEYYGMNCIHPGNPSVGIFVEFSRKGPSGVEFPQFRAMGERLLKSVEFTSYK